MTIGPVNGLISGLDTATIISELMGVAAQPRTALKNEQGNVQSQIGAWQTLSSAVTSLATAGTTVGQAVAQNTMAATSSNTSVVSVSASTGASAGSLSLSVGQLAMANQVASGGFASTTAPATTTGGTVIIGNGLQGLGLAGASVGTLAVGTHTLKVSTASAAASLTGSSLAGPVSFSASSTLTMTVNGQNLSATVNAGTYSVDQLASALSSQLGPTVAVTTTNGALTFSTSAEGASQSLGSFAGSAVAGLGLASTTGTSQGTNATVSLDGGTPVAVDPSASGGSLAVGGASFRLSGAHLAAGSASLAVAGVTAGETVSALTGQLAALGGFGVATLDTGSGANPVRMVFTAGSTGTAAALTIDSDIAALQATTTLRSAQDAQLTVGSGAGAITVTRPTNTITGVLPGVTLSLNSTSATPVTVSSAPDDAGLTTKVQTLLSALNTIKGTVTGYTSYSGSAATAGILFGDSSVDQLSSDMFNLVTSSSGSGTLSNLNQLGVSVNADGTFGFDAGAFSSALQNHRSDVMALLSPTGIVGKMTTWAQNATTGTGLVQAQITSLTSESADLSTRIANWTTVLAAKQQAYQTEFNSLETSLGQLRSTQNSLAGMFNSLSTSAATTTGTAKTG